MKRSNDFNETEPSLNHQKRTKSGRIPLQNITNGSELPSCCMSTIDVSEILPLVSKGQFNSNCLENSALKQNSFSELRLQKTHQSKTYTPNTQIYFVISTNEYYPETFSMGSAKSKSFQNTQLEVVVDTNGDSRELLCTEDIWVDEFQDLPDENAFAPSLTFELVVQPSEEAAQPTRAFEVATSAAAFPTTISAEAHSIVLSSLTTTPLNNVHIPGNRATSAFPQSLVTVPDDILLCIFQQLDVPMRELNIMKKVCKRWSTLIIKWEPMLKVGRNVFVACEELDMMLLNEIKHSQKTMTKWWENRVQEITPEMRAILVDWLVDVCEEFQLHTDTLFLCIGCVDRFLSVRNITRDQFQLLGITCLLIAAKYEELYVPTASELAYISDNTYTKDQVMSMEGFVLNSLGFSISFLTSNQFTHLMLQKVIQIVCPENSQKANLLTNLSSFFSELTLLDCQFLRYYPSLVGTATVVVGLQGAGLPDQMPFLQSETNYKQGEIKQCADHIIRLWKQLANETTPLAALRNKYSQPKFGSVAKEPLNFDQLAVD